MIEVVEWVNEDWTYGAMGVHLVGLIHHWVAVGVVALGLGVSDGERFELHVVRHAKEVLGVGDGVV